MRKITTPGMTKVTYNFHCIRKVASPGVKKKLQHAVYEKSYNSRYDKIYNFQCMRKVATPGTKKVTTFSV